jgi:hypothetical protein
MEGELREPAGMVLAKFIRFGAPAGQDLLVRQRMPLSQFQWTFVI